MKRLGTSGLQDGHAGWLTFCMREFATCELNLEIITVLLLAHSPGWR